MDSNEYVMDNIEDIEGNMDHPIDMVFADMDEMEGCHIEEDKDMNMDHPIRKGKTMGTKVRFQVLTKVEIVNYSLY